MNHAIGISLAAVLVSVCGGIGLSLANTSSDSRWDMPLFGASVEPVGYGEISVPVPTQPLQPNSVRETKVAVLSDEIEVLPAVRDLAHSPSQSWTLPTEGLAPLMAARPKARATAKVAAIGPVDLPDRVLNADPVSAPKRAVTRTSKVSRSQATPLHRPAPRRSTTPEPDFLIGVYR